MINSPHDDISSEHPINLLGFTQSQLITFFESIGEKKFRAKQIMKWIYQYHQTDFQCMTDLSKLLRDQLTKIAHITPPPIVKSDHAKDGVMKWLMRSESGSLIETVFIPETKRGTLCISSQVGCALNCSFCSTGKQGFNSNLTTAEIIGQVWQAVHQLKSKFHIKTPVTNVVMMGMGEPLLNFEPVMNSMNIMMDDWAYGLSKRRVTLSTSGVVPAILKMPYKTEASLAISLHAPTDALRNTLVPINKKYPISELLSATKIYMDSLPDKRKVTIEYTLMHAINDRPQEAKQLVKILKNVPCKINLIPFNPFPGTTYQTSSQKSIRAFQTYLQHAGFNTTVRKTRGQDIAAACGQLAGQVDAKNKKRATPHNTSEPIQLML
ncbi:MAG: 23S rRNA (adenine(2503)-C(2))-methyltransferase RlmN [Endozoicomonadaceae bacterium]|nr:23S rRNA (adenine(2503)-C(2))-methyltransferase RlmN [Endozoicomonadaceae bacterium]MBE8233177.1 23S rRNA (adenine(2503)-C(2))-methyltransferase RlmN [Endozoicomonadaceae bacterium]